MQKAKRRKGPGRKHDDHGADETTKHQNVNVLINDLMSQNLATRLGAHYQLVICGAEATPALVRALGDDDAHLRLAAAQTLRAIADPAAAAALARALDDDDASVRWVAAEGLIELGAAGLRPTLRRLLENPLPSPQLKASVQHVAVSLSEGRFKELLQPLADAFHDIVPDEVLIVEAHRVITHIEVTVAASEERETAE